MKKIKTIFVLEKSNRGNWMQWRHEYFDKELPFSCQCTPLFWCFPGLINNHSASILHLYSLAYSELCQTSKMEAFARIVLRKNYLSWKPIVFLWFLGDGGSAEVSYLDQNHFIIEVPRNCLVHICSSKSNEILIFAPICLNLVFRYKVFKYKFQIHIQHFQIG